MKLGTERIWWLKQFPEYGWSIARPVMAGQKKWIAHTVALVKMGLLERASDNNNLYRLTESGRAALS